MTVMADDVAALLRAELQQAFLTLDGIQTGQSLHMVDNYSDGLIRLPASSVMRAEMIAMLEDHIREIEAELAKLGEVEFYYPGGAYVSSPYPFLVED